MRVNSFKRFLAFNKNRKSHIIQVGVIVPKIRCLGVKKNQVFGSQNDSLGVLFKVKQIKLIVNLPHIIPCSLPLATKDEQ